MSLVPKIGTAIQSLWAAIRSVQDMIRRNRRDLDEVQRVQNKNAVLLPGVKEFGPLATPHQLVMLKVTEFVGGTPALWNAKRQMLGPGNVLIDDDEDLRTYIVDQAPGANGVYEGSFGFGLFDRIDPGPPEVAIYKMVASETITFLGKNICTPLGSPDLTAEVYYVQLLGILAGDPGDPAPPIVTDAGSSPIIGVATNLREMGTHTHGLRVGDGTFEVKVTTDNAGKQRWFFQASIALLVMALGGQHTTCGETMADGLGFLHVDHWDKKIGPLPQLHVEGQDVDSPEDYAFFGGTHWRAGTFDLDKLSGAPGTDPFPLTFFDKDDKKWRGVTLVPGLGGRGLVLYVWKTPTGDRLFVSSKAPQAVREITFDPVTKAVGVIDFGWDAHMGTFAQPSHIIALDDGAGEKLWFFGFFFTGSPNNVTRWDGVATFSDVGGTGNLNSDNISDACLHDFEDGLGPRPVVAGFFSIMGGVPAINVAALIPVTLVWEQVGSGVPTPVSTVTSVCSFNKRLWLGTDDLPRFNIDTLKAIANTPGSDWVSADKFITNMARNGLWRWLWGGGGSAIRTNTGVDSLTVYNKRLHVGAQVTWREGTTPLRSGPLAGYDSVADAFRRALPAIKGTIKGMLPYDGGILVFGDVEVALPDGSIAKGLLLWRAPVVSGDLVGTWEVIANVVGTPNAAAMFNGKLHIAGDISEVDGVPVDGLARLDATAWVRISNFAGTIKDMVVAGTRLIIVGNYIKVDGQASLKIAVALEADGQTISAIFADITAADGAPFLNAVHVLGSDVVIAGWFDSVDTPAVTAHSIAKMSISTEVWSSLDDAASGTEGVTNSRVVHSLSDAAGLLYAGTDPDARFTNSGNAGLWTWDPAIDKWLPSTIQITWSGPTVAMTNDSTGNNCYVAVESHDGFHAQYSVYKLPGDNLIGGDEFVFNSPVVALCFGDAGDGLRPYAAGGFDAIGGNAATSTSVPAQLIVAITEDDKLVDVAGGAGVPSINPQFLSTQKIKRMRVFQLEDSTNLLLRINRTTGAGTSVGAVNLLHVKGLAFDNANGILFGITEAHLVTLDTVRGTATIVGAVGLGRPSGLAFDQNTGLLYSSVGDSLISISPSTGEGTIIGSMGSVWMSALAFGPASAALYGVDGKRLFTIDTATAQATVVGDTGLSSLSGLTLDAGDLLSVDGAADILVRINITTAVATAIGPIGQASVSSLAFDPTSSTLFGATTGIGIACPHMICTGFISVLNDWYSQHVAGIDMNGRIVAVDGGLTTTSDNQSIGPLDIKAIPRSRWPAYWSAMLPACASAQGVAWFIVGTFSNARNNNISDAELGIVEEDIPCKGIILMIGLRFYGIVPPNADPFVSLRTAEVFGGFPIVGGGGRSLQKWVGDRTSGSFDHLKDPLAAGGMPDGIVIDTQYNLEFEGVLWMVGTYVLNPFTNATPRFGLATYDGLDYALVSAPGWLGVNIDDAANGIPKGRTLVVGDLGDGVKLYAGGLPNIGGGPVIVKGSSGWAELGSGLTGECLSMTIVKHPAGSFLMASGTLFVNGVACSFAKFDGVWSIAGHIGGLGGVSIAAAAADTKGHASCESGPMAFRGVTGGAFGELGKTLADLGTPNAVRVFGIVQHRESDLLEEVPGGGVNSFVQAVATAQETIWPDP